MKANSFCSWLSIVLVTFGLGFLARSISPFIHELVLELKTVSKQPHSEINAYIPQTCSKSFQSFLDQHSNKKKWYFVLFAQRVFSASSNSAAHSEDSPRLILVVSPGGKIWGSKWSATLPKLYNRQYITAALQYRKRLIHDFFGKTST